MMRDDDPMTMQEPAGGDDASLISYQDAKRMARHDDPAVRRALASRDDAPPEILYYLADDPDPEVRRAIVHNRATPALAHLVLVDDHDESVRADLASRIVRLAPGLSADDRDRARQAAYRVLEKLARDQLPRVRQILSEALKDVADAPSDVIHRLARDAEEAVAAPVLEFSPVLRDEDLLDIIAENPSTAALSAISRRSRVGADVADAIAATDDVGAIAALLGNASAQIREETLDALIERAEDRPSWHEPLVHRPHLHQRAAQRLAHFVADRLIEVLIAREDLSPETLSEVKRVVHRRLEKDGARAKSAGTERTDPISPLPMEALDTRGWTQAVVDAYRRASAMAEKGTLTPAVIVEAIKAGDVDFVAAALAVRGRLSPAAVQAAIRAASPRGIAAMVWRAKLSPALSLQIQSRLARIPPRELVSPADDESFGLTQSEMDWQVEMFSKIAAEGAA